MVKNVIVIGGGVGGYVASIRAAQLGAQVTLVEKESVGGVCVNRGCIPTKALLQSAKVFDLVRSASAFGISAGEATLDLHEVLGRKQRIVTDLVGAVTTLLKKNKVKIVRGMGGIKDSTTVNVLGTGQDLTADSIILATGSTPAKIPVPGSDGAGVITSDDALAMDKLPSSIIIIGAGAVGLEFAQIFSKFGAKVTVLEMMPHILPAEDGEMADLLARILAEEGIEVISGATVRSISAMGDRGKSVVFSTNEGEHEKQGECVLLAVGRSPSTTHLGLEEVGIATENKAVRVDSSMQTNIAAIYAVGDLTGGMMLAHAAMEEGKCAAENIMGLRRRMEYGAVPRCVYTWPEFAAVGLTEEQSRAMRTHVEVGRFPVKANGRAVIEGELRGMVKVIADAEQGELLGVHVVGPHATEMVAESALAIAMESTIAELTSTIHAHPTLSEAVLEAALNAGGRAIHI